MGGPPVADSTALGLGVGFRSPVVTVSVQAQRTLSEIISIRLPRHALITIVSA
jgi:hypothetical protein